jgi:HAD superfamily hydrolase (TIGR01484 family)
MSPDEAARVRFVLMDIDDTLTSGGKLPACAYASLWKLREVGFKVIPVTGRPAGWCDCITRQWPVDGVIGENGALVYWEERGGPLPLLKTFYHPNAVRNDHPLLERIKERALREGLRAAKDQFARLFDLALDFAEEEPALPLETAERVKAAALEMGAAAKVSSIHVNVWMGRYDKLDMAERFLASGFGWRPGPEADREVIFVGDSPNDEPLFARFPLACAVANVRRFEGMMRHLPAFVSDQECGEGFAEIAEHLRGARTRASPPLCALDSPAHSPLR